MAGPKKKKTTQEQKTTEEQAFQSAANSEYNILTPMFNAEHVRIKHPFSNNDIHASTKSEKFFQVFKEFSEKGLAEKLESEMTTFGNQIDSKWHTILTEAKAYCANHN